MNYFVIGFYFGIGFALANTVLTILDRVLAMLLVKYRMKNIVKTQKKPKPPEGLNFGSKI